MRLWALGSAAVRPEGLIIRLARRHNFAARVELKQADMSEEGLGGTELAARIDGAAVVTVFEGADRRERMFAAQQACLPAVYIH